MPIDNELLEILVCPESQQTVALASAQMLEQLNAEIDAERLRNRGGDVVEKHIEEHNVMPAEVRALQFFDLAPRHF